MAADIKLIATDLDGTLIGSANELPLYTDFNEQIERLRERNQAIWVACTGRKFASFADFFTPMRRMGLLPDYVIIRHAFIYRRTPVGFLPHLVWNISIMLRMWREGLAANDAIDDWHQSLTGGAVGVSTIRRAKHRLSLRFESDESARVAADLLRQKVRAYLHLRVFHYGGDVDVRSIPATKGMALSELSHYLDIEREQILAIGNGSNDLSMLDGNIAGMTGCPANSDPEIIEAVHKAGGHVSGYRSLRGVIEILHAYDEGSVSSALPQDWEPAPTYSSPARMKQTTQAAKRHAQRLHPLMFGAIAYAAVLVFACFDVLPYSSWIRLPLDLLIKGAVKLVSLF